MNPVWLTTYSVTLANGLAGPFEPNGPRTLLSFWRRNELYRGIFMLLLNVL